MGAPLGLGLGLPLTSPVGGSAWSPADLANLELWLDASDATTVLTDVDGVYQWNDKSGGGWDAVQATGSKKPDVVSAWSGGLDAVQGDGADDYLDQGGVLSFSGATTFAFVLEFTAMSLQERAPIMGANTNDLPFLFDHISSDLYVRWGTTFTRISSGAALSAGKYVVLITRATGGTIRAWINGSEVSYSGSPSSTAAIKLRYPFAPPDTGTRWSGTLGHVLFWSADHSADAATINSGLNAKWAIY